MEINKGSSQSSSIGASACSINYKEYYFTIEKVTRTKHIKYVFIGSIKEKYKYIFEKIKKKKKLNSKEINYLNEKYDYSYTSWINLNSKTTIIFIEDLIYMNDSIERVKEKIMTYISTSDTIYPNNQQLWYINKNKQYRVIGTLYEKLKNIPIIIQYKQKKLMKDKDDYVLYKNGEIKRKKNKIINENNYVLYDILTDIEPTFTLYVADIMDEINYLQSKKVKIKKDVLYGYLNKYWIKGKLSQKMNVENIINKIKYNSVVNKFLENTNVIKHNFDKCNIIQCYMHVNWNTETSLDLLGVYNKLRMHLSNKMPFLKYKYDDWDVPYISIYSKDGKTVDNIPQVSLEQWLYSGFRKSKNEQTIKMISNTIIIKVYLYTYDEIPRYFTITLDNAGRMHIVISFVHEYSSNLNNIKYAVEQCNEIIDHINENSKNKLRNIFINIKDDDVVLSDNLEISRIYTTINYKIINGFKLDDMYNMGSIFSEYIIKKQNNKKINAFSVKYIKISNFENMNDIFESINELYSEKISEIDILSRIEKKFSITTEKANNYLKEWKKTIGVYVTKKNIAKNSGINILIDNVIKITGAKTFRELHDVYNFITKFITIYYSKDTYKHDKVFKSIIKNSKSYVKNIQNTKTILSTNSANIHSNIDNIFNNSFGSNMNSFNNTFSINNNMNTIIEKNSELGKGIAKDIDIEKSLLMTCDDPIPSLDVCTDICDDPTYILRRLQRFDNRLFKFSGKDKTGKKIDNYSRKCGRSNERQPIVLNYDPDLDETINRNSYTYAVKFRSGPDVPYRWYICPRVWDSLEQKPVLYKDVTNIKDKRIEKGKTCRIGLGPYGNKVLVNHTEPFDRKDTPYPSGFYPGFLKPNAHPDGLCMPCCFEAPQRDKNVFKKCIGEDIEYNSDKFVENYVLGIEKFPLEKGRFGIIPLQVGKLLTKYKLEHGYMKENEDAFLRRGIIQNRKKSFIYCMAQIIRKYSNNQDNIFSKKDITILLKTIGNILKQKPLLFNSLQGGLLKRVFNLKKKKTSSLENYIKYLIDDEELLNINFVWDLFQRPGIIIPEGLNIIIFNGENIICPIDPKSFYDNRRKTVFIYKYINEYEPIYYTRFKDNKMYNSCIFSYNNIVEKVLNKINTKCIEYYNIDWKQVLKNNNYFNNKINQLKKQYTLNDIIKVGKLEKKYKIKYQIIDHYFKVIMVQLETGLIIPVKPTSNILEYTTIDFYDINLDKLLTYTETKKEYNIFSKKTGLELDIVYKLLDINNKYIVNVMTNTGVIIPIRKSSIIQDDIKIKNMTYFYNANKVIKNNVEFPNERVETINKVEFEKETYERMRLLLSKLLNKDNKLNKIKEIIKLNNTVDNRRDKLINIIKNIMINNIYIDSEYIELSNYKKDHIRQLCYTSKKCNNIHCKNIGNKCLLRVMKTNLINGKDNMTYYISNLAEEILRLPFKGNNILNNKVSTIIDTKHINKLRNEILLDSKEKILNISKYYIKKEKYHDNINKNINFNTSSMYNFNKNKYIVKRNIKHLKYTDIELPSLWKKILKEKYKSFKYRFFEKNTIKSSLEYIINNNKLNDLNNIQNINQVLTNKLNINILIMENRITKENPKGYILYSSNENNKYILIYKFKIKNEIMYSPIIFNNKLIIFTKLPDKINDYIERTKNNKCLKNTFNKSNKNLKKSIKINIKKKKTSKKMKIKIKKKL